MSDDDDDSEEFRRSITKIGDFNLPPPPPGFTVDVNFQIEGHWDHERRVMVGPPRVDMQPHPVYRCWTCGFTTRLVEEAQEHYLRAGRLHYVKAKVLLWWASRLDSPRFWFILDMGWLAFFLGQMTWLLTRRPWTLEYQVLFLTLLVCAVAMVPVTVYQFRLLRISRRAAASH